MAGKVGDVSIHVLTAEKSLQTKKQLHKTKRPILYKRLYDFIRVEFGIYLHE